MLVKPKQSQTGVMCVASARWVVFPGAKVESEIEALIAQASWKEWKFTGINLQAASRGDFQAAPALVALLEVHMNIARVLLIFYQRLMRAGGQDAFKGLPVRAQFAEPVLVVVHHIVHRAARLAGHAAQRQVLDRAAKPAARMTLDVRKVDQEAGILDHSGHLPFLDALDRDGHGNNNSCHAIPADG